MRTIKPINTADALLGDTDNAWHVEVHNGLGALQIDPFGNAVRAQSNTRPALITLRRKGLQENATIRLGVTGGDKNPGASFALLDQHPNVGERDGATVEGQDVGVLLGKRFE